MRFIDRRSLHAHLTTFLVFTVAIHTGSLFAAKPRKFPQRAAPPQFTEQEQALFPKDAFAELVGERPIWIDPIQIKSLAQTANKTSLSESDKQGSWSDWIDEETLESEIKRQAKVLTDSISSAARFKSGVYRQANDALGMISILMAINAEHDGVPRWQDLAAQLRERFATGDDSVEGDVEATDASFASVFERSEELAQLIRGGRPNLKIEMVPMDWSRFASRGSIMRRMEQADEERLSVWIVDRRTWRRHAEAGRHESQVLAALAEAILQPTAYDGEDEDYQAYARALRDAATELVVAADEEDQPAAQAAHKKAMQSCRDCHADYRG